MTRQQRVRYDMFIRVVQFIRDNAADFPAGVVAAQLAVLIAVVDRLQTLLGDQSTGLGEARFEFHDKDTARENLRQMLSEIAETARSMVYQFSGVDLKFRMPRNHNDADLLGKAHAFQTEAAPLDADFQGYGMERSFLADLQRLIDDFEASLGEAGTAIDSHVKATAEIGAEMRKGMVAVRTMDGVIRNKYRRNVGKLAAWLSASHIERVPVENPRPKPSGEGMKDEG